MNKSLMKELANVERIVEGFAAQRKPEDNRLTTIMPPGVALTYAHADAGKNTSGELVRFCTADFANVAGYFLGWRETVPTKGKHEGQARRRDFIAHKDKAVLERMAKRRAKAFPDNCLKARQRRIDRKAGANLAKSSPKPKAKAKTTAAQKVAKIQAKPKPKLKAGGTK